MIFVTVGTQLPFDRLLSMVEDWLLTNNKTVNVNAQVGDSKFTSKVLNVFKNISPKEFSKIFENSSVIVAHAGMGSILTALQLNKPIIIFPRLASLGEHRNDHQLATINSFSNTPGVYVATNKTELFALLDNFENLKGGSMNNSTEYSKLLVFLKEYSS